MNLPIVPNREQFRCLAATAPLVPVYGEILCDTETPVSAYAKLECLGERFLLESVETGERFARYSFVGAGFATTFCAKDGRIEISAAGKTDSFPCGRDPLVDLEKLMEGKRPAQTPGLPPFFGGAVGFLSFDAVRYFEPTVPAAALDDLGVPDAYFVITDTILIFDHLRRRLQIVANAQVGEDVDAAYDAACQRISQIAELLSRPLQLPPFLPGLQTQELKPATNMTHEDYLAMTASMKEFIEAGDIFQVVPSQRFEVPYTERPLDLYRALRSINPSPYMFCLEFAGLALVGSSPEIHVRCQEGQVAVRPIAGTRKRGATQEEDLALEKELLADEKERAEHLMLVDLARNDIGRVCAFHSVKVPEFMIVERYSHVMHIVSHVEGALQEGHTMFDVMRATFPAGTVSGAPKVRAMQIIAEKEPTRRGSYAGAVGYFSFSGNLDSCIAIRTVLIKDGRAYLQAGGGLVADSTPQGEYEESINKAKAGMRALALALAQSTES